MPQPAKARKKYETQIGRSHLSGFSGWPPPAHVLEHLEVFADFIAKNIVNGTILDLGCGDGAILRLLAERSPHKQITGVDLEAHEQWKIAAPKNLHFQTASILNLPFKPHSFDVVMMKDVLHHMPNPERVLADVAKLAKKQVLVIEANRYNPVSFIRMVKIAKHEHFSRAHLKRIVNRPHQLYSLETHVWPGATRPAGRVHDAILKYTPGLSGLRNYNLVLFEA